MAKEKPKPLTRQELLESIVGESEVVKQGKGVTVYHHKTYGIFKLAGKATKPQTDPPKD